MTGHVRRRGTTWAFVVDIGRDPSTGARKQRWRSGFRTRKAAERELAATLHQLDVGTYVESSRITVGAFLLDEWMPARRAQLRDSTFEGYLSLIRVHVIPRIGARRLQDVSPPMLNTLYGDLLATGGRRGRNQGGPLAPQTVRNVANLYGANLVDANLTRANLVGANLRRADLGAAYLEDAHLEDANLRRANLTDANLSGANLTDANLSGANLERADLTGAIGMPLP